MKNFLENILFVLVIAFIIVAVFAIIPWIFGVFFIYFEWVGCVLGTGFNCK